MYGLNYGSSARRVFAHYEGEGCEVSAKPPRGKPNELRASKAYIGFDRNIKVHILQTLFSLSL